MISVVNMRPFPPAPVIPDFGWYYGNPPTRLSERTYTIGTQKYPPGNTTLAASAIFDPTVTTPATITVNALSTSVFASSGSLMVQGLNMNWAQITYTGTTVTGGLTTSFTGCLTTATNTGTALTFSSGTAIFDPRFYVDQAPLNQLITFDTQDTHNLGLPKIIIPQGLTIRQYMWDLGNGTIAYGPEASTTYDFITPPPIRVKLTVTDSLNREFSVMHPITLVGVTQLYAKSIRV